jgi:predicted unusual protein kinase regulating ubiquinone biosynthesis (AarF/ABC1/UbiB family)
VARLLNDVYAEQMLRRGILHADPHPGNLRVQPGPRLVLLDHGLTVPLSPELTATLRQMVQALATGDFAALAAALTAAGLPLDAGTDIATLLRLVGVLLGTDPGDAPGGGFALGKALGYLPPDLVLVGRALGLLDGITRQLDPRLNTLAIVAQYA